MICNGWDACEQDKLSDCGLRGDHHDDPCIAVFKLPRRF